MSKSQEPSWTKNSTRQTSSKNALVKLWISSIQATNGAFLKKEKTLLKSGAKTQTPLVQEVLGNMFSTDSCQETESESAGQTNVVKSMCKELLKTCQSMLSLRNPRNLNLKSRKKKNQSYKAKRWRNKIDLSSLKNSKM